MQKAYRAVSSAIYGKTKEELVMSVSVVAAYGEDDIRLEQTDKQPIDTASPDSVRTRFNHLLAALTDTVTRQKEVNGRLSVPVVFGVPRNFKGLDLTDTLRASYAHLLQSHPVPKPEKAKKSKEQRGSGPQLPPGMSRSLVNFLSGNAGRSGVPLPRKSVLSAAAGREKDQGDDGGAIDVWDLDKALVEHLLRRACVDRPGKGFKPTERYKYDMTFHPRLFQPLEHGIQERLQSGDAVDRVIARSEALRPARGMQLKEQYDLALAGNEAALARLREMAKEEAHDVAVSYVRRIPVDGRPLSRFLLVAPPLPPFTTAPEFNFLQWFDLRKIFGAEFARVMQIRHPICVKAPADPPSPAFADVAATYAYQLMMKAQTGKNEVNGTVMITSREQDQA